VIVNVIVGRNLQLAAR